jgi:biotin carboxyl carrier protein
MEERVKKLTLDINGKLTHGVVALAGDGALWVHLAGETFLFNPKPTRQRAGKSVGLHDASEISAPMPGKIIQLSMQKGDVAKVGQVLVVMEAMKMEYTLKAAKAGRVDEVLCAAGDQVELGQVLLRLELTS